MTNIRAILIRSTIFAAACSALVGAYTYYYTDSLTSINTSNWTENGTLTAGSGGLTSSNSNGGSLISKVAVPDGSSNYEVKTTLTLTQSGGTYVTYLRASSNAMSGPAVAGTAYAFEVQNPTFSGSACSATLAGYKIINGSVTALSSTGIVCHNGVTLRVVIVNEGSYSQVFAYIDNTPVLWVQDSAITSGLPGIGVRGAPSGNSIAQVQLGGIFNGAPVMPPISEIGVSAFANKVELQWPGASESSNGPGVAFYQVFRNGTDLGWASDGERYVDTTVSASTNYSYWILAFDYDLNYGGTSAFSVTTPPSGAIDARETGVRPTGSYWGGGGEQIDMLSGNLNYTTPILKAMGRGGWGVGFNLTYNSQNWRQDPGGTWQLGEDVGYGYGWKLLAGSLLPLSSGNGIGEYLFTDATGAQYHLNQNSGGVWASIESIYVSYDSNAGKLHFNDGSFWVLGSTSAGTEWDAGTMYPTLMEDSNGNQVFIAYEDGIGVTWNNSSSRINTIEDVRGNGSADYTFTYNTDSIPHLTGITNTIKTAETYTFAYTEGYALNSPFSGNANFGTVTLLKSSQNGIPLTTYFTYDTTTGTTSCTSSGTETSGPGQLTQVTTPYCGYLRWTYTVANNALLGTRTYNEVQNRYLSMFSGAAETEISLVRAADTANTVHSSATLQDTSANAEKVWTFETTTSSPYLAQYLGLELSYEEFTLSPNTALSLLNFNWAQTPTSANPYIGTTVTKLNPGTYENDKQTVQTLDQYGNMLTMKAYNFGAAGGGVGTLARTYTNTYLGGSNYTSRYIFNRLVSSTVTDGTNTATLVSNTYDSSVSNTNSTATCTPSQQYTTSICEHDTANYPYTFTYRGDLSTSTTPTTTTSHTFDMTGTVLTSTVNGVTSNVTPTNNWAVPGQITTNTLTSTMNWSSFLGISSATGPNGDSGSINYDANARPSTVTSPYGAVTTYTYNDTASPPNKIATTNGHWVKTVMDGFGRTIHTITGYGSTTVSTVDAQYAPCGCSPLGKMSQQSQPYGPNDTEVYTKYTYDASGRTLTQVLPDGSTTTYSYQGQYVGVTPPVTTAWKQFTMDAFGNLTGVAEPDPALGTVWTLYSYDVLNHLTQVSMTRGNTQTRTFNYNSLTAPTTNVTGFLQTATNPENGTVTYAYSGNLLASKTDAKNQKLTYAYDSYNRLTSVTWTNAPGGSQVLRTYYYDTNPLQSGFSQNALGRLTAVQYPGTTIQLNDMYSYTLAGLPATKRLQVNQTYSWTVGGYPHQAVETANLDTSFTYNNEGKITAMTYPSTVSGTTTTPGPSYNYSYDSMYRLSGMTSGSTTVVNGVSYNAANQLLGMSYFGDITEARSYNTLNQLVNLTSQIGGQYNENLTYNYPTGTNNGKISSMYNAVSVETISYTYDSLNRLLTAAGTGWNESYGYDGFGNLTSKSGSPANQVFAVDPTTNRLGGTDANGNAGSIINGSTTVSLSYDAENRLNVASTNGGGQSRYYAYDAQNRRILISTGATDSNGDPTNYTVNVYTPGGQKLGAYNIATALLGQSPYTPTMQVAGLSSDQYFGARRLAPMDQLGSAGNNNSTAGTYFPWGEPKGTTNPQDAWSYATYWTDSFSTLDYANNRYYSNAYGRFMTPDPSTSSRGPGSPQSWNRFAYTAGDPVNRVDPSGKDYFAPVACNGDSLLDCTPGGPGYCDASEGPGACDNTCIAADGFAPMPGPNCDDYGEPAQTSNSTVRDCGGQLTSGKVYDYCNVARSGASWNAFKTVLSNLKTALKNDPDCADWLFNTTKKKTVDRIISELSGYFATADYIVNGQYVVGTENDLNPINYAAVIINWDNVGTVPQAVQFLDILHELAHVFSSKGIVPDGLSPALGFQNDRLVMSHCDKAIDY